ncbi:MAG: SusC/RagA family TonB-linked outer membrane protein, partial [Bacteroidales bacterium]
MKQLFVLILMFASFQAIGQVTGTVYDGETNETLPGSSVQLKGTTVGVTTDMTGKYSIQASIGDILIFSFVGYEPREITVTDLSLNVKLYPSINILDEVVVVGYGVQKKSDITGSVISISADKLKERPQVNLTQSLQGSMAGLSVNVRGSDAEGTSSFLMIRGQNSITASNTPLIILDGVPYSGALSEINSSDIESFEVLKDASSTAIYGSRGANGVILITTKKGEKGSPVITYDAYYRMDRIAHIPDMMDGETFAEAKMEYGEPLSATEQRNYDNGNYTDWIDLATQNGGAVQHNLSVRGATEKVNYYVSAGLNDVKGIAKEDRFKRASLRTNVEINFTDWLRYGTNTQFGYYDRSGIPADFRGAFEMNPLGEAYNEDGSYTLITWEDAFYADNPLSPLYADSNDRTWRVSTNNYIELDLPFIDGLSYKLNTGYDFRNRFFQRYYGTNTQRGAEVGGELYYSHTYDIDWLLENIISYNKTFGKHTLFLTGLYSAQQKTWEFNSVEATGFSSDLLSYYQPGNSVSPLPGADYSKRSYISQMFRANYSYDSRYLFTFTIRRDGFSGFGENTKFGVFPSVAMGWNITNEEFFKNMTSLEFVSNLKLRLSYGENGNEAITPYSTLPALSSHNYLDESYTPVLGYYPMQLGNPLLGWETSKSTNLGLDFSLWNNRLNGLVDIYWTNTYDLLLDKSISPVNGTSTIRENIGQTHNNGIEFQLSSVNISSSDFVWRTDLNFTHYNTKIVHVGLTDEEGNYIDDIANEWFIG